MKKLCDKSSSAAQLAKIIVASAVVCSAFLSAYAELVDTNSPAEKLLRHGHELEQNDDLIEAFQAYREAAELGSAEAMVHLYFCYWDEKGVSADHAAAMRWLNKAAEADNACAEFLKGYRCANPEWKVSGANKWLPKPDWPGAFHWYSRSAEQNWPGGQYQLGMLYLAGQAVAMDEARGLELVRTAADQGLTEAKHELARLYARGIGEPRSENERPVALLERLDEWGELQFCYEHGLGAPRDLVRAARSYSKMLMRGTWYNSASDLADKIEFKPPRDDSVGTPLIEAPDGHVQMFGPAHRSHNPSDDVLRALSLYLKAATGDGLAATRIGRMYLAGQDAPKLPAQAWLWFSVASRNGSTEAETLMATAKSRMTEAEIQAAPNQLTELAQELNLVASAVRK